MSIELVQQSYEKLKECLPVRNSFHQKLAFNLYNKLSMGSPVSLNTLAKSLKMKTDEVKSKIADLPGVYKNEKGEIVGFWGLAVGYDSPHRLSVDGVTTNTWCAWDALFIPEVIGKSAEVSLTCPVTGFVTKLDVAANGLKNINNDNAVISFILPETFDKDVIKNFCHFI